MSVDEGTARAAEPIDLGRAPDFDLGPARVRPSQGEVVTSAGSVRLQPRVMQVLVALARSDGQVVSRDDLVASCWGGLTVGDDAINRCIGRLRRLAEIEAPGAFAIRTLARIGYCLTPGPANGAPAAPGPGPSGQRGGALTLAVMPFANRSGLTEDEALAFGMAEDLIDAMSQGLDLRVVSSSALAGYGPDGAPNFRDLARDLDVTYVLEGHVRRRGDSLRVTAQLVDTQSGAIVWTQPFERPLARLAVLQEELVLDVAAHLRAQARHLEISRALRKPGNLTAWEAVMRCAAAFRRVTGPALDQAAAEARRAVEIDPDYGLALAYLSVAEAILYYSLVPDDEAEVERIRALAEKAQARDPRSSNVAGITAHALLSLGMAEEGLAAAERAVALNPNNEAGHMARGRACALLGRLDEAIAHFDLEQAVVPNHPTTLASLMWRATAHARGEDWPAARKTYDQALALAPDEAGARVGRAMIFAVMGRAEEARADLARARKLDPSTPLWIWDLRFTRGYVASPVQAPLLAALRALWAETEPRDD